MNGAAVETKVEMIERFFVVVIVDRGGAVELAPVEGSQNGILLLVLGLEIKQKVMDVEVVGGSRGDLAGLDRKSVV